jgi:peptidyl-tRNA hydrolase, PTH1 family
MTLPDSDTILVAGLGNPGDSYTLTRHNIGFLVADALALALAELPLTAPSEQAPSSVTPSPQIPWPARVRVDKKRGSNEGERRAMALISDLCARSASLGWRSQFGGVTLSYKVHSRTFVIFKPLGYMNLSGEGVGAAVRFFRLASEAVVVVHDDLDLAFGKLRLKFAGGHAGHNGLRSIDSHLGCPDYFRLRAGIGRPDASRPNQSPADWVLERFSDLEIFEMPSILDRSISAIWRLVFEGLVPAQQELAKTPKSRDIAAQ